MQQYETHGNLEELTAFVAVAEAQSFVKAAGALGRDASVLSRRVSQLEARLGVRLLARTTRRVALTEVGSAYYQRVRSLLDELEMAGQEASDFAGSPRGLLRIALPMAFGRLWVAPLLPPFLARHPQIRVDARFGDRFVDLVAEGFDVAVRLGVLRDSSLTARKVASYRTVLVASPAYLARHGRPGTPADLADHACLGFTGHASWPDWLLAKDGQSHPVQPKGPLIADNSELLLLAALQGTGIVLAPEWLAGAALREGRLVEVLPGWAGQAEGGVYIVLPPGRLVPTKTRVFVDEIAGALPGAWAKDAQGAPAPPVPAP